MFRTAINPRPSQEKIELDHRIVAMGSCFSEMMGKRLSAAKFDILSNPLGIIFNPVSQFRLMRYSLNKESIPDLYVENNGIFHHYDAHSRVHAESPDALMHQMNVAITELQNYLSTSDWLFLTFGTARVYTLNDRIVANCHKQPGSLFSQRLLTVREMMNDAEEIISELRTRCPGLKIIITVSPVRHIRDTLEINSVSKSLLRVFCHELSSQHQNVHYFPSYEIMMDDLRDYRFYSRDMIHPNDVAEDYIFDAFKQTYLSEPAREILVEWNSIRQALEHKPFHPDSPAHQTFLTKTLERLHKLSTQMNVGDEIEKLNKLLNK